ncbi:tetratricopeptide repeat protein [Phenylobacterium montanum]|uniref:Tetratricopeptide repeat protein n=1 Tax=Phenylobacterium montanum TaxID=2823693 RepID=A0A975G0F3_9CAUL|nr:tetratricopeptide repeat protein [Caulobacter sp. S6]QUD88828.1 tetratricopeptide repeat protein [Caulobacter sp. S6]
MVDVFEEVEEQLRSDRYRSLARTWVPWVLGGLGLALALALAYWGYTYWREQGAQKASTAYAAGLEALQKGDEKGAAAQFAKAGEGGSAIYRTLSLMQQAGVKMTDNDAKGAVVLFDQAAQVSPDPMLADAARLKAAYALFDTASDADVQARLTPLAENGRPFRPLAYEALAMLKLKEGKTAEARADFKVITTMLDAPQDLQKRAQAAIVLIDGGTASAIPNAVKAANALPPGLALPPAAPAQQSPEAGAAQ